MPNDPIQQTSVDQDFAARKAQSDELDAAKAYFTDHPDQLPQPAKPPVAPVGGPGQGGVPTAAQEALQTPSIQQELETVPQRAAKAAGAGPLAQKAAGGLGQAIGNTIDAALLIGGGAKAGSFEEGAAALPKGTILDASGNPMASAAGGAAQEGGTAARATAEAAPAVPPAPQAAPIPLTPAGAAEASAPPAADLPPLLRGQPIVDDNVRDDFFQHLTKDVPNGEPGIGIEPEQDHGWDYIMRQNGGFRQRIVYRGPDGSPVAIGEVIKHSADADPVLENFAVDKSKGLLSGKGAIAVGQQAMDLGAKPPAEMSSDAAALMQHAQESLTATPEAAAQTLAQKQIDNLKAARVGESVAQEFGRPDIATNVPINLTLDESHDLQRSLESYYSQSGEPPKLAAHLQALATTYQDEAQGIHDLNQEMRMKATAGEDVTALKQQLVNRWSAYAENYSTFAGARSDVGRSLQILDPNKPANQFATETAKLAQELGTANSPEKLSDMLDQVQVEQYARLARQNSEDFHLGRNLYDAFNEYYYGNLLSNPARTMARVGTTNAASVILSLPTRAAAAAVPGSPYKFGEPIAALQGVFDGFWHAIDVAKQTAASGERVSQIEGGTISPFSAGEPAITAAKFGLEDTGIGTGIDYLGSLMRLPGRGIGAVHQFTHAVSTSMAQHMEAFRAAVNAANQQGLSGMEGYKQAFSTYGDTVANMPAKMRLNAAREADQMTMVNGFEKGSLPDLANQAFQLPVLRQLMPFFKIAYNVKKWGADMTPGIGALTSAPSLLTGDAGARSTAAAKIALSSFMGAAIAHEYHQGNIVLDKYGSPQFKVGDHLISVPAGLDVPIGTVGNYLKERDQMDDPTAINKVGALVHGFGTSLANDSLVETMVNLKRFASDVESGDTSALSKLAAQQTSGLIPFDSLLRAVAGGTDTTQRNPQGFGQELETNIPGLREQVPESRDMFAQKIPGDPVLLGLPDRLIFPVNVTKDTQTPLEKEISRLGVNVIRPPDTIFGHRPRFGGDSSPDIGVPLDNGAHDGPQHQEWIKYRADGLKEDLQDYLADAGRDSDALRKQTMENIAARHAREASNMLVTSNPDVAKLYDQRIDRKADIMSPMDVNPEASSGGAPSIQ